MLNNNTHILLDDEMASLLKRISKTKKTSIGKLIRKAIKKTYIEEDPYKKRKEAFERILKIRPPVSKTPIDYKELINYGRKY